MIFNYTVKTQKNIDDMVVEIKSKLSEIKFGVLGTLDFKEIFAKKGIDSPNESNYCRFVTLRLQNKP